MKTKWKISPYLYLLPALIIVVAFRLVPIVMSFVLSFFDWSLQGTGKFIGLENYAKMMKDPVFWQSMGNTFWLVIILVPTTIVLSLFFAVMLNKIKYLKGLFRIVYFMPFVTSLVAVSIVWKLIFNEQTGLMNTFLGYIGISPQAWLSESRGIFLIMFENLGFDKLPQFFHGPSQALFAIIIMTVWKGLGYNTIIYLAGLQNISKVYYEAAEIDGAGKGRQFWNITVPLISPTTFYVLIMTTITTFQAFSQIYLMTDKGGPLNTTKLIVYYIYERGFDVLEMGYASAVALALFILVLALTIFQRRMEKHVNY
ncbi:MAG: sugar ABC transporter permease [Candidatus Cloacimonetes bacterium]|jgi:multiple sugar transport system permease protein|nr:sugar ABC transporter permease [Candidatus Cloacimonadota bacterium]MDY0299063.1 sugar ABC transporter permease [Candidatus Cloacimonadaceae bacterium]MCB5279309.1 sugar ABC transporter permease [Candidatus Cloacimonadota bacterium]MCK9331567.1 sugar ABC transporter permease [Candidatus Cloacimonadota bacterium]MDD2211236.1 sugar ABC transporter permease [Candidatus Cloacimonadota bacterium]